MERYLSAKEIMACTGLSRSTVYELLKLPGFPFIHVGKRLLVSERALGEWLARCGTEPTGTTLEA